MCQRSVLALVSFAYRAHLLFSYPVVGTERVYPISAHSGTLSHNVAIEDGGLPPAVRCHQPLTSLV